MLKSALIGCGVISEFHARAYNKTNSAELVAVCDINLNRAKKTAKKFNVKNIFSDYQKLLKNEELDFIEILTQHSF